MPLWLQILLSIGGPILGGFFAAGVFASRVTVKLEWIAEKVQGAEKRIERLENLELQRAE